LLPLYAASKSNLPVDPKSKPPPDGAPVKGSMKL